MTFTASKPKMREHDRGVEWSCGIKLNGVVVANVFQAGRGGCDEYTWLDKSAMMPFADAAEEFNKANGHTGFQKFYESGELSGDFCTWYVEDLMAQAEYDQKLERDCKKHVCARLQGDDPKKGWRLFKGARPTPEFIAAIKAKYPGITILNPGVE